jgi:hypothetical protein
MADSDGKVHPTKLKPGFAKAGLVPQQVERVSTEGEGRAGIKLG